MSSREQDRTRWLVMSMPTLPEDFDECPRCPRCGIADVQIFAAADEAREDCADLMECTSCGLEIALTPEGAREAAPVLDTMEAAWVAALEAGPTTLVRVAED